ncbi:MarR family transcriptional regulator [Novosphingobium sp. G106]|uniref:MarR family winged helix-turn-helix transcriptional regulator n=1 Tax=Novosphingobium sp. G106 TaxID=2849500 RepID=UPI001C2D04FB|nr:MarR family transcriptional regulator [Novosphingobium sp. G106]MBV1687178.1 MarR family transcriptional regulator [Novosphingobium sp. G106]
MTTEEPCDTLIDPLADKIGYQLRRASLAYLTHLTLAVEAFDLRIAEMTFLMFVAVNPGCSQGEVSRVLGVKRTNMVPTVTELVKRGYLVREAADGRTNALTLTASGMSLHASLSEAIDGCDQRFFGDMAPAKLEALRDALLEIRAKA